MRWRGRASRRAVLAAVAGALALAAAAVAVVALQPSAPARRGRTIEYDVPAGTAARLARGEAVSIVPARIVGRVGDTLRLVNNDERTHTVGPFIVSPGQRLTIPLARVGTYIGACSLHPSRRVAIVVRA
jgi:plastocyanin